MKKKLKNILLLLIFLAGLSLLLYPTVSNAWNSIHATEAVISYREASDSLTETQFAEMLSEAAAYNQELSRNGQSYYPSEEDLARYESLLDPNGTGMMGYLEIPSIDVSLPIYHGSEEAVLQSAVGHLNWTSLPIGGDSTHCVLSGHRGLPGAKLFTDLDQLAPGDLFTVTVLNQAVTYEVDKTQTVTPDQVETLNIRQGQELCTLVTCTPYGINTHRLLVQGHRVENTQTAAHIASEAEQIQPVMVMPFVALPLLVLGLILINCPDAGKNGTKE